MFQKRPSHTTVVAYLALFAALATGGAYAADKIGSGDIKKNAVKSKHIGPKQVKASDIRPGAARPRAIAYVDKDGGNAFFRPAIVPTRGFTQVESGVEGYFCLTPSPSSGLDPHKDPPVITFDYGQSSEITPVGVWDSTNPQCEDDEFQIDATEGYSGSLTDSVAFVITVP